MTDEAPAPAAATAPEIDPLKHPHACPYCYKLVECSDPCSTVFDDHGNLVGSPLQCDACEKAPPESIDIITGKVSLGDTLRCDEDGLVYEVESLDRQEGRAELHTVIGYPKGSRAMKLASDGSPARRNLVDGGREPLWFRVTK